MVSSLQLAGLAGRNDPYVFAARLHVNDKEKLTLIVETNDRVPGFKMAARIDQTEKWIEEDMGCLLKSDAIMLPGVGCSLLGIPDELQTVQVKANVHLGGILTGVFTLSIREGRREADFEGS
jgi:hypothetical protein